MAEAQGSRDTPVTPDPASDPANSEFGSPTAEAMGQPAGPAPSMTPSRAIRSLWSNRWVQNLSLSLIIACVIAGYYRYQRGGWTFLPPWWVSFESLRQDDAPARRLAARLGIPEPPDLTGLDEDGARNIYLALKDAKNYPGVAKSYGRLGLVYEAQGMQGKALELYLRAVELDDQPYEWHYHAGLVAIHLARPEIAHPQLERALELNPDYAPTYVRLGNLLLEAGQPDRAEDMFEAYVQRQPEDVLGPLALARAARERGDWQRVLDHVEVARKLGRIGKAGQQLLGMAYHHLGDADKSKTHLQLAQTDVEVARLEDPLEIEMLRLQTSKHLTEDRYEMMFAQGRFREALRFANELVETTAGQAEHASAWGKKAECHRLLGEFDEALTAIAKAKEMAPMEPEPRIIHGLVRLAIGDLVTALNEAEEAVTLRAGYTPALLLRGQALLSFADQDVDKLQRAGIMDPPVRLVERAVADLRSVVGIEPTNADALFMLGFGLGKLGEYEEASRTLERVVELRPDGQAAPRVLAAAKEQKTSAFWPATQPASGPATQPDAAVTAPAP